MKSSPPPPLSITFRRYAGELQQFLRGQLRCPDTAADLAQETYLRLMNHRGDPIENLRAYMFRTARNLVIDHVRANRRRSDRDDHLATLYEITRDAPELDSVIHAQRELAALDQALGELPRRTQTIFRLSRVQQCSHRDIALQLGISLSTVEKQMALALDFLRERLGRQD